jgi:hypothetical protein
MQILTLLPLYALAGFCLGCALIPATLLFSAVRGLSAGWPAYAQYPAWALTLGMSYFIYGTTLVCFVPLVNHALQAWPYAWRGPYYSLPAVKWYIHNGLTYLVRYTFLEFITPTPFNLLFYKWMGMKIGEGTQINTSHISDPSLIELGQRVTIGGSATIVAHYGMGGYLVIAPTRIGDGATIGLRAIIMGGAEIGAGAKIMPNSVVLPKTKIPPGETWGGVPAQKIDIRKTRKKAS